MTRGPPWPHQLSITTQDVVLCPFQSKFDVGSCVVMCCATMVGMQKTCFFCAQVCFSTQLLCGARTHVLKEACLKPRLQSLQSRPSPNMRQALHGLTFEIDGLWDAIFPPKPSEQQSSQGGRERFSIYKADRAFHFPNF